MLFRVYRNCIGFGSGVLTESFDRKFRFLLLISHLRGPVWLGWLAGLVAWLGWLAGWVVGAGAGTGGCGAGAGAGAGAWGWGWRGPGLGLGLGVGCDLFPHV